MMVVFGILVVVAVLMEVVMVAVLMEVVVVEVVVVAVVVPEFRSMCIVAVVSEVVVNLRQSVVRLSVTLPHRPAIVDACIDDHPMILSHPMGELPAREREREEEEEPPPADEPIL